MRARLHLAAVLTLAAQMVPADAWAAPKWRAADVAQQQQLRGISSVSMLPLASPGDRQHEVGAGSANFLGQWTRGLLAALAVLAVVAGSSRPALAEEGVNIFFGQGCFWHVQHEFVKKEVEALGRTPESLTALSGYAGGTEVGDGGRVCYHNMAMAPDYGRMGHTEVVNVNVPEEKVGDFAKFYFDSAAQYRFGRADPQDLGTEYRSAIGIPGGIDGPLYKQVEAANEGRFRLLRGKGGDADTVASKKIWIYDSTQFPFYQGEVYHQFHDDMGERYSKGYHALKQTMLEKGALKKVGCPEVGF